MGSEGLTKRLALGIFYEDMGYHKDALQQLESVLKEQPDNITALVYSALACAEEGDYNKAEKYLRKALLIDDKYPLLYSTLAIVFFRRNRYDEAEFYAKHALKLSSNDKRALMVMGDIYYQRRNIQYALMYYEHAVSAYPNDATLRCRCALALRALGRLQDAIYELRRATEIEPSRVDVHLTLGELYEQMGEKAKAMEHYESAASFSSDDAGLLKKLARAYEDAENLHIASQYYTKALNLEPSNCETMRSLARIKMKQKLHSEALTLYLKVLQTLPDDLESHIGVAKIYASVGDTEREIEHLRKAVSSSPSSAAALLALTRVMLHNKRYEEALKTARKLLSIMPDDPHCWELAGDVYLKSGYTEEALFNYQRAIITGGRTPSVFYKVAGLYNDITIIRLVGTRRATHERKRYLQEALRLDNDLSSIPSGLRDEVYRILSTERILPFGRMVIRRRLYQPLPLELILFERVLLVRYGFRRIGKELVFPLKMLSPNIIKSRIGIKKKLLLMVAVMLLAVVSSIQFSPLALISIGTYLLSSAIALDVASERKGVLLLSDSITGRVVLRLPASEKAYELLRRIPLMTKRLIR